MRLVTPLEPSPTAPLARANPIAKLAAALVLMAALFASLDGVTAGLVLGGLALAVPFAGLPLGALVRRSWLIAIAAVTVALANMLFANQAGPTVVALGPLRIGAETAVNAIGLGLRLVAIALAGILAVGTSQPTALADGLIQQLRVSPRFALGTVAALRLVPLLAAEWQTIGMARRARGVDAGRSPLMAVRLWAGRLVSLLVRAVRRASRLANAMEARGLGAMPCRTNARVSRIGLGDLAWVAGAALLAAAAVAVSVALGTWRPLFG